MSNFFKQGIAYILFISLLLESCSSPYMGSIAQKVPMPQGSPTKHSTIWQADNQIEPLFSDTSLNPDNLALIQPIDPLASEQGSLQDQDTELLKIKDSGQQNETDGNILALIQPLDRVVGNRELLRATLPNTREDKTAAKQPNVQQPHQALSAKQPSFSKRNSLPEQKRLKSGQKEAKRNRRTNAPSQVLKEATKATGQVATTSQVINAVVTSKPEAGKETQTFTAKGGHQVQFQQQSFGQWEAVVVENLPVGISRTLQLPVYLEPGQNIATIGEHNAAWQKNNIHVVFNKQKSYVFVGVMGLLGGMMEDEGDKKNGKEGKEEASVTNSNSLPTPTELTSKFKSLSIQDNTLAKLTEEDATQRTLNPLQDLPHVHFATFIERTALQSTLQERLLKMSIQPLAMTVCQGIGGVGKSQLAIRMLHDEKVKDHFGLRLWFQDADRPEMLAVQYLLLARELGLVDEKATPEKALKALHAYLASYAKKTGKPWLAIYDNADSPSLLKPYLAKGGHVLITTRNNEWPDAMSVDGFEPMEAEALTVKLLQREDPAAKTLCQELDYFALGIVQACAYIRHEGLSIPQYVEKLRLAAKSLQQDELLFGKKLPSSMMALLQITFETLEKKCPDALTLLHAVAYLAPDSIPQEILSKLASPKALEAALQYALLQKSEIGFSMHRLTQQVLLLQDSEEEKAISLQQVLESVCEGYSYDPLDLPQRACNRQLLSHFQTLIAHSEAFKALPETLESALVSSYNWLADLQRELAQPHLQKKLLKKGLVLAKLAHGEESSNVAVMLNKIGSAWNALGEAQKAITYYEQALPINLKTYGDQHLKVAIDLNNIGTAWDALGDVQKAITYYEQALAINIKTYGNHHPTVATSLSNIGSAWNALGKAQKALPYYEQALDIDIKTYGAQNPTVARGLNNIGQAWDALGEAKKALTYYEQALTINVNTYGDQHPTVVIGLNKIGGAWKALGEAKKAITYFEQALAINLKTYSDQHPDVARDLSNIGSAWDALGEAKKAITYLEQALDIDIKTYGNQHPQVALDLNNVGSAWQDLGDAKKAIEYYKQALAIDKNTYGDQHPEVAIDLNNIGSAWDDLGDTKKAIEYYEQAYQIALVVWEKDHPSTLSILESLKTAKRNS